MLVPLFENTMSPIEHKTNEKKQTLNNIFWIIYQMSFCM